MKTNRLRHLTLDFFRAVAPKINSNLNTNELNNISSMFHYVQSQLEAIDTEDSNQIEGLQYLDIFNPHLSIDQRGLSLKSLLEKTLGNEGWHLKWHNTAFGAEQPNPDWFAIEDTPEINIIFHVDPCKKELALTIWQPIQNYLLAFDRPPLPISILNYSQTNEKKPIGNHPQFLKALFQLEKVADSPLPVLIRGESGTGKEVMAEHLHNQSLNSSGPMVSINCAAFPKELLESELFGHEKGAFTGADKRKIGLIESATEGTLFMDEIGEMPLEMQAKFLRFLQNKEFRRIGGTQILHANVRLVFATHRDLEDMVKTNLFREDLYYRINVLSIELPSLKERKSDIPALVNRFLSELMISMNKSWHISPQLMAMFQSYDYPGNIRELKNIISRIATLSDEGILSPSTWPYQIKPDISDQKPETNLSPLTLPEISIPTNNEELKEAKKHIEEHLKKTIRDLELQYVQHHIEMSKGNVSEAATITGTNRTFFYKMLERAQN